MIPQFSTIVTLCGGSSGGDGWRSVAVLPSRVEVGVLAGPLAPSCADSQRSWRDAYLRARHNDFRSGRLTSGANRGLAFTRPEPHNEQRIIPYLIGGQPWHRVAHFLLGWMSIRRRSQWRMWPRSGRLKSSPWARLAPGNVTSTR